jgi:hypothetical protein
MGSRVMWSRTLAHPPSYLEDLSNRCAGSRKIKCFVNKPFPCSAKKRADDEDYVFPTHPAVFAEEAPIS